MNNDLKIITAEPSGLGLFGLALVTLVASSSKLGLTEGTTLVIPWAIFLGALAQLAACANDFKKNNVFGATAFGAYGLFWLGVAFTWLIQADVLGGTLSQSYDLKQLGFAYLGYLVFTLIMTFAALKTNKVLFIIFVLIDLLFLGLTINSFTGSDIFHKLAAYAELSIAIVSFYGLGAVVINHTFGYDLLPQGKPFNILQKK